MSKINRKSFAGEVTVSFIKKHLGIKDFNDEENDYNNEIRYENRRRNESY